MGPRCRTSPRTRSPVSAPRRPRQPAAPQRRRGSSSQQVSWVTLLHSHTRPSLSWDSFPSAGAQCACATPTTTDSSFFLKLLPAPATEPPLNGRGGEGVLKKRLFKNCEVQSVNLSMTQTARVDMLRVRDWCGYSTFLFAAPYTRYSWRRFAENGPQSALLIVGVDVCLSGCNRKLSSLLSCGTTGRTT